MHTLSACGTSPQLLILPIPRRFSKPGCPAQGTKPFPAVLGGVNLTLAQPKIVPDLVPNRVGNDPFQVCRVPGHLFVRTLKNANAVRTFQAYVQRGALGGGATFVQTQQIRRRAHRLHHDDKIPHADAKLSGNIGDRAFYNRVEGFGCEP
jgi:hypothetical protein